MRETFQDEGWAVGPAEPRPGVATEQVVWLGAGRTQADRAEKERATGNARE